MVLAGGDAGPLPPTPDIGGSSVRTRRRAACVLLVVAPLAVYGSPARACPHHAALRTSSARTLRMARRRKRGSRDDLARPPDIDNHPQNPRNIVSRDTNTHWADGGARETTRRVTEEGKYARRRLVADNIRHYRTARGISQDRLAIMLGVNRRQVLRWEGAYSEPRDHLDAIADALGVTVADLYAKRYALEPLP